MHSMFYCLSFRLESLLHHCGSSVAAPSDPCNLTHMYISQRNLADDTSVLPGGDSISPVLLTRARSMAFEHSKLSNELREDFNHRTAKRIGELSAVINTLKEWEDANSVSSDRFIHYLVLKIPETPYD